MRKMILINIMFIAMGTGLLLAANNEDSSPAPQPTIEELETALEQALNETAADNDQDLSDILDYSEEEDDISFPARGTEENSSLSVWKKLQIFWSLPRETKMELIKEHIKEHKVAYSAGSASTAALIIALIAIKYRKKQ